LVIVSALQRSASRLASNWSAVLGRSGRKAMRIRELSPFMRRLGFGLAAAGLGVVCLASAGCKPAASANSTDDGSSVAEGSGSKDAKERELPSDEEFLKQIDDVLDFTYEKRRLSLADQAAWQIIHGSMAFGRQYPVKDGDKVVSAVDHVLAGGKMNGWNLVQGDLLDEKTGRYGVRSVMEAGTKTGQGHADQWLGYLSYCNIPLSEKLVVEGKDYTLEDMLLQAEKDVNRNPLREYSWTLMALTTYRPTDYKWIAGDGQEWSIEKLVEIELEHSLDSSPCGGTHRMVGLTMARNKHLEAGGKLEGVWKKCDERIQECIAKAREYQNPDGSLSSNYLQRPGKSADLASSMGSAGHVMELLTTAMTKEELEQPWVKQGVYKVTEIFRKTKPIDMECGALFHAAHGLILYREKMYGPRTFPASAESKPAEQTAAK